MLAGTVVVFLLIDAWGAKLAAPAPGCDAVKGSS
jgi:hypothetical protein